MAADVTRGSDASRSPRTEGRPPRKTRSWPAVLALTLAAHLGLLYLASLSLHGPSGAGREPPPAPAMSVGLVGPLAGAAAVPSATDASATTSPDQSASSSPDDSTAASEPEQTASGSSGVGVDSGSGSGSTDDPRARASTSTVAAAAGAPLDDTAAQLWLQISRCWKAQPTHLPLTLTLILDEHGALREDPAPLRAAGVQPSGALLVDEAIAARAVKACAPYTIKAQAPGVHQVHFAGDPANAEPPGVTGPKGPAGP